MVLYVLDAVVQEDVRATVVVVGHGATWVEKSLTERARADVHLTFVEQSEQLGTGHAVSVALPTIDDELGASDGDVLILPGDTPLLRPGTIARTTMIDVLTSVMTRSSAVASRSSTMRATAPFLACTILP
jgi:bifunctional UDP-N-acetylglucosamine pyrophosphorylase/glucosamine-1-phosphate N-acetyltransferase